MKKLYVAFLALLVTSCVTVDINENDNIIRISIKDSDFEKGIYIESEIVSDKYYIPLETIDSVNLIGKVSKVVCYKNKIYVLDRNISKALYIFSYDGSYLGKIDKIGDGPGEFKMPHNYIVLEEHNQIVLYCRQNNKLLYYDLDGEHLFDEKVGISFKSFLFKDSYRLYFTHSTYNFIEGYGKILYDYIVLDESNMPFVAQFYNGVDMGVSKPVMTHNQYFTKVDGEIYLSWVFNDTIYKINDHYKAMPHIFFDFGNSCIPEDLYDQGDQMEIYQQTVLEGRYRCKYGPFLATDDLRLISISAGVTNMEESGFYIAVFSKKFDNKLIFNKVVYNDDALTRMPLSTHNEYFISVIYPEEVLSQKRQDGLESGISLTGVRKQINEFDNPILMFTKYNIYED